MCSVAVKIPERLCLTVPIQAGIVGTVDLSDPRYAVTIENCKNTGKVFSANHYYAGIAADIGVKADNTLTIAGCTNETDFTEGEGAGIVYELVMQKGNMLLSGMSIMERSPHPGRMPQVFSATRQIWEMTGS